MKKQFIAVVCAAALAVPVLCIHADYGENDIKSAVNSAIRWKDENDSPFYSIGSESSNLYITALHSLGKDYDYASYLHGLDGIAAGYGAEHDASDMQKTVIAVEASGGDAQNVGGTDLVADSTFYRENEAPLGKDGADGYSWALIALDSGDYETPEWALSNRNQIIAALLSHQNTDGSFDGNIYSTAAAITALSPYIEDSGAYTITQEETGSTFDISPAEAASSAVQYLSDTQLKDGDWGDLISTAMSVIALETVGINPDTNKDFIARNGSALDGLMSYRNSDGGFAYSEKRSDGEATSYALCALVSHLRRTQNKAPIFRLSAGDTAALSTPQPSPSSTPTPSPRATSSSTGISSVSTTSPRTSQTSSPQATSSSSSASTSRPSTTVRPSTTTSPTKAPTNTMRPTRTAAPLPSASPSASASALPGATPGTFVRPTQTPTPRPTQRPALVGPVDIQGPVAPTETPEILESGHHSEQTVNKSAVPFLITAGIIVGSILLLLLIAAAVLFILKKKNKLPKGSFISGLFGKKHKPEAEKPYEAKQHRKTEEHRKFEQREKFKEREKYKQRLKYRHR